MLTTPSSVSRFAQDLPAEEKSSLNAVDGQVGFGFPVNAHSGRSVGCDTHLSAVQGFTVSVAIPNRAPQFTSTPITTTTVGRVYRYTATASDADAGDELRFFLAEGPSWLSVSSVSGIVSGTPTEQGEGAEAVQACVLAVRPRPTTPHR